MTLIEKLLATASKLTQLSGSTQSREARIVTREAAATIRTIVADVQKAAEAEADLKSRAARAAATGDRNGR